MNQSNVLPVTTALLTMSLIGFFVTSLICGKRFSGWLLWALAPGVGAGICSLVDFLFRRPMLTIENTLLILLAAVWLWRRGIPDLAGLKAWRPPILGLVMAGVAGWAFSECMQMVERVPHGDWDGWAIWNSHARYLYRDGPAWQSHIENTFHADYPLLVPLMTVRLWRWVGADVPEMGGVLGLLLTFSGVALLAAIVAELRGTSMGLLMGLLLLATPSYLTLGAHQEADVPLSLFFLGAIGVLCLYFERTPDRPGVLALSGFMAGCAGWTKNEGSLLILAMLAVLLLPVFWRPGATVRRLAAFSAGLLLPLAVIIFFKISIAPPNDLTWNRNYAEIVGKILNSDRHAMIRAEFFRTGQVFGGWAMSPLIPLLAFIALKGIHRDGVRGLGWRSGVAILGLVLAGYYSVYVLTPNPLKWHLDSSLRRLLIQLWPSFLLLTALIVRHHARTEPGEGLT